MTTIRVEDDQLILEGTGERPRNVVMRGARAEVDGRVSALRRKDGPDWRVRIPLRLARWGTRPLPLPAGEYVVDGLVLPKTGEPLLAVADHYRVNIDDDTVTIAPPHAPETFSRPSQDALEQEYARSSEPLRDAVFFESFYGRVAGCNPAALDREIARRYPEMERIWSVTDYSVDVPEGARAVVDGSPEWWQARAESRVLIINDWMRRRFVRRAGQRVLQTWHGTPLKRLALHRRGFDVRRIGAILKESRRWDALLAQNGYGRSILSKAYAYLRRPVWVEGYPRNDALVTGSREEAREMLGLGADERVVLYAPTWRDDRQEIVDDLDPARLAAALDATVLVRGHTRTLQPGHDVHGPRVIDVTAFADGALLMLAADELVTDYSSIMFDFSLTAKPMYFFVPDLQHYRGTLRGFYFDLTLRAPGPLVASQEALESVMSHPRPEEYEKRYAEWRERFNARDDGRASERIVTRMAEQEWFGRAV